MSALYVTAADVPLNWNGGHGSYSAFAVVCADTPLGRCVLSVRGTQQDTAYDPSEHRYVSGAVETYGGSPIDWTTPRARKALALAREHGAPILVYHNAFEVEDRHLALIEAP